MTSPSSSITTSGPSSPTSPLEEASQPYTGVPRGFYIFNYDDERSESQSKRKAEDGPTDEPSKGSTKRVKLNPLAKSFYPISSPTSSPTPPHPSIFIGELWRCCQLSSTGYLRLFSRASSRDNCEHVKCVECDKKTAEKLKRERGNMVAPMILAAGEDKVQNSSWATPSMTRYAEGDPRRRCSKELSVEDMKRILKKDGSQGSW